MRSLLFASFSLACALGFGACSGSGTGSYVNALTGEACEPDQATFIPKRNHPPPDQCQGTSNGDNCDDLHSGKVDCIGDGNSGQGDDKKHNCEFPQPGCDDEGCCDPEVVVPPPDEPEGDGDDGDDGDDGYECDGGVHDPGDDGDDPPTDPPTDPEPTPVPDVG